MKYQKARPDPSYSSHKLFPKVLDIFSISLSPKGAEGGILQHIRFLLCNLWDISCGILDPSSPGCWYYLYNAMVCSLARIYLPWLLHLKVIHVRQQLLRK